MSVRIGKSKVAGSGVFATSSVEAWQTLLKLERPAFAALDKPQLARACSNCFAWRDDKPDLNLLACAGCHTLKYCSKRCQAEDWKRIHKHDCKVLKKLQSVGNGWEALPDAPRMGLSIVHAIAKQRGDATEGLQSLYDKMAEGGGQRFKTIRFLGTGIHKHSGELLPLEQVCELFAKVLLNSFTLTTPSLDVLGVCLDPTICKINHSCDPNAYIVFDGPELFLRSLRPIAEDEEIFIPYVDTTSSINKRQFELNDRYYFLCSCTKCQQGSAYLWERVRKREVWGVPPPEIVLGVEENAHKEIARIKSQYEPADASGPMKLLWDGYAEKDLFPIWRSPMPFLQHELLLNFIDTARFLDAFYVGMQLQNYSYPRIYPQDNHPIRAIHVYILAKLAGYLWRESEGQQLSMKSECPPLPKGFDFSVCYTMFVTSAVNSIMQSHGLNNALTQEVMKVATGLLDELNDKSSYAAELERREERNRALLMSWCETKLGR